MNRFLFVLLLLFSVNKKQCIAQTPKIDSLKKISYSGKDASTRLEAILLLLRESDSMPFEEWVRFLNDAEALLKQVNTPATNCAFAFSKSKYFISNGNADSARYLVSSTVEKYKTDNTIKQQLLLLEFRLAAFLVDDGKYKDGIEAMLTIVKKAEEQKDNKVWCYACNSIGFCYMDMGRYDEAIVWFRKVVQLKAFPNERLNIAKEINNLASCLNNIKQYDSALFYIAMGIEKAKAEQNLRALANGYNIKADILINIGQKENAEPLLMDAIKIRKQIGNADFIASDMAQLSIYYATVGQYEKGISTANEALKIFNENKLITKTMFAYEALRLNYKNKGDNKNYAFVLEKMLALKDSLYTTNSAEALTELQQKFEVEKKEKTIAQQQLDLVKRKILLYSAAIATLFLLLIFGYRFKKYQQKQKLLAEEKRIQNELAVKDAAEKERKRIAAELHDNLGVQANAILHNSTLLNTANENQQAVVEDLQDTAKEMLLNLRETLWAMKTSDVPATDLWLRIINFMKQMGRHYTTINFKIEGEAPVDFIIPSNKALNMVLMLQEAVNNAVKHAAATEIKATSNTAANEWRIAISDNGKGFNLPLVKTEKKDGYGLGNMQERATASAIALSINSETGNGTSVILTI